MKNDKAVFENICNKLSNIKNIKGSMVCGLGYLAFIYEGNFFAMEDLLNANLDYIKNDDGFAINVMEKYGMDYVIVDLDNSIMSKHDFLNSDYVKEIKNADVDDFRVLGNEVVVLNDKLFAICL